jgi:hypothetical protein
VGVLPVPIAIERLSVPIFLAAKKSLKRISTAIPNQNAVINRTKQKRLRIITKKNPDSHRDCFILLLDLKSNRGTNLFYFLSLFDG